MYPCPSLSLMLTIELLHVCCVRWWRGTRRRQAPTGTMTIAAARVPARRPTPSSTTTSTGDCGPLSRPRGYATSARTSSTLAAAPPSALRRGASGRRRRAVWSPRRPAGRGTLPSPVEGDVDAARRESVASSREMTAPMHPRRVEPSPLPP